MRLHEEQAFFRQAVTATAAELNIPEIFIEKISGDGIWKVNAAIPRKR